MNLKFLTDEKTSADKQTTKPPEAIKSWLITQLASQLELPANEIDIHKDFTEYGLNSIEAVNLSGGLETFLDCRLSPTLVWDYPNIDTLVQHLAGEPIETRASSSLDPSIQPKEAQQLLKNIDQLTDDTVDTLLASMVSESTSA